MALMSFFADVHSTDSSPLVWVCPEGHPEYLVGVWSAHPAGLAGCLLCVMTYLQTAFFREPFNYFVN